MGKPLNQSHMGYAIEMRTRPQTIGIAFNDNSVGIMVFVGENYSEIADPALGTATLENTQWPDTVYITLSIYLFTLPGIMKSMLCYYENVWQ
jgi:hypothetical protein